MPGFFDMEPMPQDEAEALAGTMQQQAQTDARAEARRNTATAEQAMTSMLNSLKSGGEYETVIRAAVAALEALTGAADWADACRAEINKRPQTFRQMSLLSAGEDAEKKLRTIRLEHCEKLLRRTDNLEAAFRKAANQVREIGNALADAIDKDTDTP